MNRISCGNCHDIAFSHAQMEGSRHRQNRIPCEDVVWIRKTPEYLFCGLADGKSGAKYGAEGGQTCLEAVSDYIDSAGIASLLEAPFPDELPCGIVKIFRKALLTRAERRASGLKEFASTFLAVAVDLKTGKYVLLHLGDGAVIRIPHTGEPGIISGPENGITSCHTWLTTSDTAVSHLRVSFGSLENQKRLLLMSDGAKCFCRGRDIPRRIRERLKNASQSELCDHLIQSDPADDAACIVLDFCDKAP